MESEHKITGNVSPCLLKLKEKPEAKQGRNTMAMTILTERKQWLDSLALKGGWKPRPGQENWFEVSSESRPIASWKQQKSKYYDKIFSSDYGRQFKRLLELNLSCLLRIEEEKEVGEEQGMCYTLEDAFLKTIRDMQLKHGKQSEQEEAIKAYYNLQDLIELAIHLRLPTY